MSYVIDGYNLLHAMGMLRGRVGPAGLEKARLRLLGLLQGTYGAESSTVTVVFDAANAPPGAPEVTDYHGIHVRFARQEEADDLIEDLVRHEPAPHSLTVVSDDHRIRDAARRRHCTALGCVDYLDALGKQRRERARPRQHEIAKPEHPSAAETEHWLHEFADLEDSADLKELSDPEDFLQADEV